MKYKDIEPGMLIKDLGLILETDIEGDNEFFEGRPNVLFIGWDAYNGACWSALGEDEEYEIRAEKGSKEYAEELNRIEEELTDHLGDIHGYLNTIHEYRDGVPREHSSSEGAVAKILASQFFHGYIKRREDSTSLPIRFDDYWSLSRHNWLGAARGVICLIKGKVDDSVD